jgi:hypothetical protein
VICHKLISETTKKMVAPAALAMKSERRAQAQALEAWLRSLFDRWR